MKLEFSFIIPVYNRPDEIHELLQSFKELKTTDSYEIVIVEDGSTMPSKDIIEKFKSDLDISYFVKNNSGPGDSRNFGMKHAKGNYFIILDSDCILPNNYFNEVKQSLNLNYVDYFGGPDAAHKSFSNLQKAINFAMTSFITTGGIRGHKKSVDEFQPRSFNMGISKRAFEASNGFGSIHPGEDPDLSIRIKSLGFQSKLIPTAFVFHKRRISWLKFYKQVYKFGMVRPILNQWHPKSKNITYWFPSLFCLGLIVSVVLFFLNISWGLVTYILYFILAFLLALFSTKSVVVSVLSLGAIMVQFFGYGYGFLKSNIVMLLSKKDPQLLFPELFFKLND
ncbi:glycosyltransferase [Yeosuana sp.]|uniref:glycosyltransferase n=1 Tax=Yeosuana sp. TaxID=2529388 RepID=UPI004054BCEC|tara:strand:- start:5246 stop:6256 length:1011 start_codon:yes stop_codon:yes gene_type:complete